MDNQEIFNQIRELQRTSLKEYDLVDKINELRDKLIKEYQEGLLY